MYQNIECAWNLLKQVYFPGQLCGEIYLRLKLGESQFIDLLLAFGQIISKLGKDVKVPNFPTRREDYEKGWHNAC